MSTDRVPVWVVLLTAGLSIGGLEAQAPPDPPRGATWRAPYDSPPQLRNPAAVRAHLSRVYREDLRERGIGGRVGLSLLVGASGAVRAACVFGTSGYRVIDDLALDLARLMEFDPARSDGEPVPAWTAQGLTFSFGILAPPGGLPARDRTGPLPPCPTPADYGSDPRRGLRDG